MTRCSFIVLQYPFRQPDRPSARPPGSHILATLTTSISDAFLAGQKPKLTGRVWGRSPAIFVSLVYVAIRSVTGSLPSDLFVTRTCPGRSCPGSRSRWWGGTVPSGGPRSTAPPRQCLLSRASRRKALRASTVARRGLLPPRPLGLQAQPQGLPSPFSGSTRDPGGYLSAIDTWLVLLGYI